MLKPYLSLFLLVKDNGQFDRASLEQMVKEVNATQVAPEDKLTDSVYHYDSQSKVFELAENFEANKRMKDYSFCSAHKCAVSTCHMDVDGSSKYCKDHKQSNSSASTTKSSSYKKSGTSKKTTSSSSSTKKSTNHSFEMSFPWNAILIPSEPLQAAWLRNSMADSGRLMLKDF